MPRKQQDDPHAQLRMIYALSLFYAKNAAKAAIRAEGKRVTDYAPKDITRMASAPRCGEPIPVCSEGEVNIRSKSGGPRQLRVSVERNSCSNRGRKMIVGWPRAYSSSR